MFFLRVDVPTFHFLSQYQFSVWLVLDQWEVTSNAFVLEDKEEIEEVLKNKCDEENVADGLGWTSCIIDERCAEV